MKAEKETTVRSVSVPVASAIDLTWKEFTDRLHESWRRGTVLANWAIADLFANDSPRDIETGRFVEKKQPVNALYKKRNMAVEFDGCCKCGGAILHAVEQAYRVYRKKTFYRPNNIRLPDFRYPYPWRVPAQAWSIKTVNDRIVVSFQVIGGGRVEVVLAGGGRFRRQTDALQRVISGELKRGELTVCRRKKKIQISMAIHFPKQTTEGRSGTLTAISTPESFLVGMNEATDRLFVINGDRIRRQIVKHREARGRLSEDRKYDTVRDRRSRKFDDNYRETQCRKQRDRVKSFYMEAAANLVNHADRKRCAVIILDDRCRDYFGSQFPWFAFATRVEQICKERGIILERLSGDENADTARDDALEGAV